MNRLSARGGRARAWLVAVVVLVIALVTLLVIQIRAHQAQADNDAQETSAWEERGVLDQVLVGTAAHVGIDGERPEVRETALTCTRNDGRQGWSYFLHKTEAGPVPNIDSLTEQVARYWESLGYAADQSRSGAVTAETPDGAVLFLVAGSGGVQLSGETGCALTDGAPGSEGAGG